MSRRAGRGARTARTAAALALLAPLLVAACGGSRSGGMRPLPAEEPAGDEVSVAYEVSCQNCTVSWLTPEGLKTRSAVGSWRREVTARRGQGLRLIVDRDDDRAGSVEARIRVDGETAAHGRLQVGDVRDRISLRTRAR